MLSALSTGAPAAAALAGASLVAILLLVIALGVFDFVRTRHVAVFEHRRHLASKGWARDALGARVYAPPAPPLHPFGWVRALWALELRALARTHGLDAALYLRLLRLHLLLLGPAAVGYAAPLCAVYAAPKLADSIGLNKVSAVRAREALGTWLPAVMQAVVTAGAIVLLLRECGVYNELRAHAARTATPRNYALLATDVPRSEPLEWERAHAIVGIRPARAAASARAKYFKKVRARQRAENTAASLPLEGDTQSWKNASQSALMAGQRAENTAPLAGDTQSSKDASHAALDDCTDRMQQLLAAEDRTRMEAESTIAECREATPRAAIVLFRTRVARRNALQSDDVPQWGVRPAPHPAALDWHNLCMSAALGRSRAAAAVVPVLVALLYGGVVAFAVEGMMRLDTLVEMEVLGLRPFAWAAGVRRAGTGVEAIVQYVLPALCLVLACSALPGLARRIAAVCQTDTHPRQDAIARDVEVWLRLWTLVAARYAAGVLYEIAATAKVTLDIVRDILTHVAAQHAALLAVYVAFCAGAAAGGYAQPRRVWTRWRQWQRARCEADERAADRLGASTPYATSYARAELVTVIALLYVSAAPYALLVALLWYVVTFPAAKYHVCYTGKNEYEGDGELFPKALWSLLSTIAAAHAGLCIFMGLLGQVGPAVIAGLPLLGCCAAAWGMRRILARKPDLEAEDDDDIEADGAEDDEWLQTLEDSYTQPALRPLVDPDEPESMKRASSVYALDTSVRPPPASAQIVGSDNSISARKRDSSDDSDSDARPRRGVSHWIGWALGDRTSRGGTRRNSVEEEDVDWKEARSR